MSVVAGETYGHGEMEFEPHISAGHAGSDFAFRKDRSGNARGRRKGSSRKALTKWSWGKRLKYERTASPAR